MANPPPEWPFELDESMKPSVTAMCKKLLAHGFCAALDCLSVTFRITKNATSVSRVICHEGDVNAAQRAFGAVIMKAGHDGMLLAFGEGEIEFKREDCQFSS